MPASSSARTTATRDEVLQRARRGSARTGACRPRRPRRGCPVRSSHPSLEDLAQHARVGRSRASSSRAARTVAASASERCASTSTSADSAAQVGNSTSAVVASSSTGSPEVRTLMRASFSSRPSSPWTVTRAEHRREVVVVGVLQAGERDGAVEQPAGHAERDAHQRVRARAERPAVRRAGIGVLDRRHADVDLLGAAAVERRAGAARQRRRHLGDAAHRVRLDRHHAGADGGTGEELGQAWARPARRRTRPPTRRGPRTPRRSRGCRRA